MLYNDQAGIPPANITISCVDTGMARHFILKAIQAGNKKTEAHWTYGEREPYNVPYYWMDFGNMMDRGQVVIGSIAKIKQPDKSENECISKLPMINELHPDIFKDNKKDDQGPSCSLAEALGKQDLFINTNLANMGMAILWKMFRELQIRYHGLYLNLDTLSVNPIGI